MSNEYVKNLNPEIKIIKVSTETVEEVKNKPKEPQKPKNQTETWSRSIKVRY